MTDIHELAFLRGTRYTPAMPKRSSRKRGKQGPEDVNEAAFRGTREATGEAPRGPEREKNPAAVALGRLGGAKGGQGESREAHAEATFGDCPEGGEGTLAAQEYPTKHIGGR